MKFKKVKLGELCDISSSKRIFAKEYVEEGIPFYRSKEIILKHNRKEIKEPLFISYDRYKEIKEKHGVPEEGDILLTSVGTLGVPYIVNSKEKFYFKDGNLTWLKNFREVVNNKYIYYWLQSKYGKNEINKITIGSTQQAITINSLKNLEVQLPSLKIQNKITRILDAIYEKENNNLNIQNNLEELAQTLFKRWFVDFEFPNEEGKPYKSSGGKMVESELGMIPEGWEIVRLSDLMDYQGGSQPPSKEFIDTYQEGYIRLIQIRDYDNDNHLTYIPDTLKLKKCNETDIMIARYGAALGRILFGLEGAYNVALAKVMPKKETYKEFLRCYLNTPYFYGRLNSMGGRSAQSGFNKADIQSFKIGFPKEKQIINDFENKTNKLFQYNLNLQKENKKLKEFRDILLPKLLSGEIELPDDMEVTDDVPVS